MATDSASESEVEDVDGANAADRRMPADRPGAEGFPSRAESHARAQAVTPRDGDVEPRDASLEEPGMAGTGPATVGDGSRDLRPGGALPRPGAHERPAEGRPERPGSLPLDGKTDYVVNDPDDPSRTITDIDRIDAGVLWEEKSATNALDIEKWTTKHIFKKFDSYLDARQHLPGYEQAPIGFRFAEPGVDPEFRSTVETSINDLRKNNPDVTIRLEWSS